MEPKVQEPIKLINIMIRVKNAFFQLWPLVLILAVLLGTFSYVRARASFVPMYETKAIFTVESGMEAEDIFGTAAYYDQFAAQQLAAAFPQILSTQMMNDLVVEQLEKGYINGFASAYAVVDTNMLVLTARSSVPQERPAIPISLRSILQNASGADFARRTARLRISGSKTERL